MFKVDYYSRKKKFSFKNVYIKVVVVVCIFFWFDSSFGLNISI